MITLLRKETKINAVEWDGTNVKEVFNFIHDSCVYINPANGKGSASWEAFEQLIVKQGSITFISNGNIMVAAKGDYIIKDLDNEYYVVKPKLLWEAYETPCKNKRDIFKMVTPFDEVDVVPNNLNTAGKPMSDNMKQIFDTPVQSINYNSLGEEEESYTIARSRRIIDDDCMGC